MTIREFSAHYRLRVNDPRLARKYRVRTGEDVVLGRYGEIAEFGEMLCVKFLASPRDAVMTGALRSRYRQALTAGLVCKWKSEAESTFLFDPNNPAQVALVVKLVGARYRRQGRPATPELLERLRQARERHVAKKLIGKSGALGTRVSQ